ncbi:MAG TPA: CHRD domain-containing protein [Longimicrobiales bacterium]|nr:CHRD domain-containing protein [Longimicrobiales bacterium]
MARLALSGLLILVGLTAYACGDNNTTAPLQQTFTATLNGASEVPAKNVPGTGTATFTRSGSTMTFTLSVANMTNVTAAHIHAPAPPGQNANVLVPLFAANPPVTIGATAQTLATGTIPSSANQIAGGLSLDSLVALMRNGQAYVNVHTSANLAGEIRGQIQAQ